MKVTARAIISRKTSLAVSLRASFWLVFALLISCSFGFSQTASKDKGRTKDFGKSLEKYKKPAKTDDKVKKVDAPNDDIIRVETNMVVTDILVADPKGNALVGLKKEDFVITEDGVPQDMELFSNGGNATIPKSIVLMIEPGGIPSFTSRSIDAAKKLVDKLGPEDQMAIVTTRIQLVNDFTNDKKLLKSNLNSLKRDGRGGRHDLSTLLTVLNELFDNKNARPIVVMQTYGDELFVLNPIWESHKGLCQRGVWGMCERDFSLSDVIEAVGRSRATIYAIDPGPRFMGLSKSEQVAKARITLMGYSVEIHHTADNLADYTRKWTETEINESVGRQTALLNIVNLSGGYLDFLEKPEDADDIYDSIFKVIENRYVIGYYPKNEAHDGKSRTVRIEVRGHPEYTIVGRKTYFAPEQ